MSNDSSRPSNTLAHYSKQCETDYCHKNAFYKLKSHSMLPSVHVLTLTVISHCEKSCYGGLSIIIYRISIICVRCKVFYTKRNTQKALHCDAPGLEEGVWPGQCGMENPAIGGGWCLTWMWNWPQCICWKKKGQLTFLWPKCLFAVNVLGPKQFLGLTQCLSCWVLTIILSTRWGPLGAGDSEWDSLWFIQIPKSRNFRILFLGK